MLDSLTELPNRRFIDLRLGGRIEALKRYGWPFGVLFMDIDLFKRVNDEHGHDVGDEVIKMVVRAITQCLRGGDMLGRWGGEEFLAIVTNVRHSQLVHVAERFRSAVAQSFLEHGSGPIRVTISIGGATATARDDRDGLVRRADKQLYAAKAAGRNRVLT